MQEKEAHINIYDWEGKVIGTKPRYLVDKLEDILMASYVLLRNSKGQFFMTKSNYGLWPDLWGSSCAGLVRSGETPHQAANRTVIRELGISPELKQVHETFKDFKGVKRFMHIFYGFTSLQPKPNPTDSTEQRWFSANEIERLNKNNQLSPTTEVLWNAIKKLQSS